MRKVGLDYDTYALIYVFTRLRYRAAHGRARCTRRASRSSRRHVSTANVRLPAAGPCVPSWTVSLRCAWTPCTIPPSAAPPVPMVSVLNGLNTYILLTLLPPKSNECATESIAVLAQTLSRFYLFGIDFLKAKNKQCYKWIVQRITLVLIPFNPIARCRQFILFFETVQIQIF